MVWSNRFCWFIFSSSSPCHVASIACLAGVGALSLILTHSPRRVSGDECEHHHCLFSLLLAHRVFPKQAVFSAGASMPGATDPTDPETRCVLERNNLL